MSFSIGPSFLHGETLQEPISQNEAIRAIRDAACLKCHSATGDAAITFRSVEPPLLTKASQRYRPQWLIDWISDPRAIEAGTRMPHALESVPEEKRRGVATDITHFLFARDGGCCWKVWKVVSFLDNWKRAILYVAISIPCYIAKAENTETQENKTTVVIIAGKGL